LDLARRSRNPFVVVANAGQAGRLHRERGDLWQAANLLREAIEASHAQRAFSGTAHWLTELALVAAESGQGERAVILDGAASPYGSRWHENRRAPLDQLRVTLAKADYDRAWARGSTMSWAEVSAEIDALVESIDIETPSRPVPANPFGLSRREQEVLQLVAQGHSNRVIADRLSLSQRTVERHVYNILARLDLDSRAAAAAFAVRHGLD
jgi:DNA-binding CsgD family transcriptional regulator